MQKSPEKQDIMGDPFMYNKQLFITCLKPKQINNQTPPRQVQLAQQHFPWPVSFTCLWRIGRPWEGIAKPSIWKLGIKQLKCSHETYISSLLTREMLIFCNPFKFLLQDVSCSIQTWNCNLMPKQSYFQGQRDDRNLAVISDKNSSFFPRNQSHYLSPAPLIPPFKIFKGRCNHWISLTWEVPKQAQVQLCPNTTKAPDIWEGEIAGKMLFPFEL